MKSESIIVKCLSHTYSESTLDGKLYMNSLHYFLNNGNVSQNDCFEGAGYVLPIAELPFDEDFRNAFIDEYIYGIPVGFKYLHIFCFSMLEMISENNKLFFKYPSDEQFKAFGDSCLVIKDPKEFFNRIVKKCNEIGWKVFIKKVDYRNSPSRGNLLFEIDADIFADIKMNLTPFIKGNDHASEMEYRILILPNENIKNHIILNIGSIRDIAYIRQITDKNALSIKDDANKYNIKSIPSDYIISNCRLEDMLLEASNRAVKKTYVFLRTLPN